MIVLLKNLYQKAEQLKGRKLYITCALIFVVFITIGLLVGYFTKPKLKVDENQNPDGNVQPAKKYYQGKVTYVNPGFYPDDKISYSLVDSSGKDIILLKSKDQKLTIAEGLVVKVSGTVSKTKDGKTNVLNVEELIIKSAPN